MVEGGEGRRVLGVQRLPWIVGQPSFLQGASHP